MGYDYYEETFLFIEKENNVTLEIELNREGYYFKEYLGPFDSDDTDYDDDVLKHCDKQMEVDFKPISIYQNGNYLKEKFKEKYDYLIKEMCKDINKIISITKCKKKYLR